MTLILFAVWLAYTYACAWLIFQAKDKLTVADLIACATLGFGYLVFYFVLADIVVYDQQPKRYFR